MAELSDVFTALSGILPDTTANLEKFVDSVHDLGTKTGKPADAIKGLTESVLSFASKTFDAITGMVEKANPAVMKEFNHAIDDVQATIGQLFIPMIRDLTAIIRFFGIEGAAAGKAIKGSFESISTRAIEAAFTRDQVKTTPSTSQDIQQSTQAIVAAINKTGQDTKQAVNDLKVGNGGGGDF